MRIGCENWKIMRKSRGMATAIIGVEKHLNKTRGSVVGLSGVSNDGEFMDSQ